MRRAANTVHDRAALVAAGRLPDDIDSHSVRPASPSHSRRWLEPQCSRASRSLSPSLRYIETGRAQRRPPTGPNRGGPGGAVVSGVTSQSPIRSSDSPLAWATTRVSRRRCLADNLNRDRVVNFMSQRETQAARPSLICPRSDRLWAESPQQNVENSDPLQDLSPAGWLVGC